MLSFLPSEKLAILVLVAGWNGQMKKNAKSPSELKMDMMKMKQNLVKKVLLMKSFKCINCWLLFTLALVNKVQGKNTVSSNTYYQNIKNLGTTN